MSVWQTDNIIKIFPGDYPKAETEPYLELAGNEYEGMQLAIRNPTEIKALEVSVDAPKYAGEDAGENPPALPAPQIGHIENVIIDTASAYFHFTDLKNTSGLSARTTLLYCTPTRLYRPQNSISPPNKQREYI